MSETTDETTDERTAAVKAHWDRLAADASLADDRVTHRDRYQRLLEIDLLLDHVPPGARVLDVGCGNGFSSARIAAQAREVLAVDYSQNMIDRARREHGTVPNLRFERRDVLALGVEPGSFDIVVAQRCLINLTSWEAQQRAIGEIAAAVRPGGLFLMQEGTRQGRRRLGELRQALGLPGLPAVPFNLDFDEEMLWPFLARDFTVLQVRRLGAYDLVSRVVHPLLVAPEEPSYLAAINEIAYRVAREVDYAAPIAREFMAVLRRRDERRDGRHDRAGTV